MKKENLVQKKSYSFALKIVKLVGEFPKRNEGFVIGRQLLQAGTSIGANVEEAIGAFSKEDFIYKMNIALKEARETHYWLRLIRDSNLITQDVQNLIDEALELVKIITSIVKTSQTK